MCCGQSVTDSIAMLRPVVGAPKGVRVDPDGTLHLPAGCDLLTQLYANHGVRVRMVRRPAPRREKIPTVRQLIDDLSKKHEVMLSSGLEGKTRSSSSTPTVPFSGSDLLYGNGEGAGRGPHPAAHGSGSDDVAAGDVGAWDQRGGDKQKLKELDLHGNKRPASKNSTNRKIPSFDKVSSEREELRPIGNSLPPAKQSPLRANGVKNNLLRADQFINSRSNGTTGREDDLVAMGTLWSPSQLQTRGSSTTTSSGKSTSAPNSGSYAASASLPARRPINLSTSTSTRQLLHHTTASSTQITPNMGNVIRKEVEPKYGDPLSGAPPSFQSRLMELANLEAETVRWERTKKVKKKPKADRDS